MEQREQERFVGQSSLADRVEIAPGVWMPWMGLGTYLARPGRDVEGEIAYGLKIGYRGIDTAAVYHNEESVGRAIKASRVPRQELFVTTKVWNSDQGYQSTRAAFERSRHRLGLDYLDLYLIHWPDEKRAEGTWRAMEELLRAGKIRAIGVCNHNEQQLDYLLSIGSIPPAVDQVELHPRMQRPALREYCGSHRIRVQAWAPLMKGRAGTVPELVQIGASHGKTPAQVSLRWLLQHGVTVIPKSVHPERIS
jgi:diketogulonate reductase-like aldo/keto reductase